MKCKYITIEREYGSGGTEIARAASEQAGIPVYGQEILREVSKKYNISVERIEKYEETATNSFLYSAYIMSQTLSGNTDMMTNDGHIYVAEQEIIRNFAANSPAVFLGHCACEALKDRQGVVNVFIRCTDSEAKMRRIIENYGIPAEKAAMISRRFDKKRANYYYANTLRKWDELRNYDVVLDSGVLGTEGCVKVIKAIIAPPTNY